MVLKAQWRSLGRRSKKFRKPKMIKLRIIKMNKIKLDRNVDRMDRCHSQRKL